MTDYFRTFISEASWVIMKYLTFFEIKVHIIPNNSHQLPQISKFCTKLTIRSKTMAEEGLTYCQTPCSLIHHQRVPCILHHFLNKGALLLSWCIINRGGLRWQRKKRDNDNFACHQSTIMWVSNVMDQLKRDEDQDISSFLSEYVSKNIFPAEMA